jgi:hypothetical protein
VPRSPACHPTATAHTSATDTRWRPGPAPPQAGLRRASRSPPRAQSPRRAGPVSGSCPRDSRSPRHHPVPGTCQRRTPGSYDANRTPPGIAPAGAVRSRDDRAAVDELHLHRRVAVGIGPLQLLGGRAAR